MSAAGQMQTSALRLFWWVGAPGTSMAYGNSGDNPAALSPAQPARFVLTVVLGIR